MEMNQRNDNKVRLIFEVANTHGGKEENLFNLIEEYMKFNYDYKAIKFQPFKPDLIALPDYDWYNVYRELFFEKEIWRDVIRRVKDVGGIWLDIFDKYGVEVYKNNMPYIDGIKLQASVLENLEVISVLSKVGINDKELLINISGYQLSDIEQLVNQFNHQLNPKKIIPQIGYQSYPTSLSDTGLQKIPVIKSTFPGFSISIADHSSAELPAAIDIPVWAVGLGCSYIEKHFCINRNDTKYDNFSALEPEEVNNLLEKLMVFSTATTGFFISASEKEYLKKTYQVPVLRCNLRKGSMVALSDLLYRRTGQSGLKLNEIKLLQSHGYILDQSVEKNSAVTENLYKKAIIGVLVACRMKSSRLKNKAIIPIHGIPAIERCLNNCLEISSASKVILTTSDFEEDEILKNYTINGKVDFWQGDPDDVIKRYLGACDHYGIDVIVRVTGDCPVVSKDIAEFLLKSHFTNGADYTSAKTCAVGSSVEIYNKEALQRVIDILGNADYSEYMTWYMQNNPDIFKVNLIDLPPELSREYRLTLDYEEDLMMFNELFSKLDDSNLSPDIANIFSIIDNNPSIAKINEHLTLVYKTDGNLIEMLNKVTRIKNHYHTEN